MIFLVPILHLSSMRELSWDIDRFLNDVLQIGWESSIMYHAEHGVRENGRTVLGLMHCRGDTHGR